MECFLTTFEDRLLFEGASGNRKRFRGCRSSHIDPVHFTVLCLSCWTYSRSCPSMDVAQCNCLLVARLGPSVGTLISAGPLVTHQCILLPMARDKVGGGEHVHLRVNRTLPISVIQFIYLVTFASIHWFTTYIYVRASRCLSLCSSLETQNWVSPIPALMGETRLWNSAGPLKQYHSIGWGGTKDLDFTSFPPQGHMDSLFFLCQFHS